MNLDYLGKDWHVIREIGSGSFGKVYEIERNNFGNIHSALKVIEIPRTEAITRELQMSGMDDESIKNYYEKEIDQTIHEFVLMSKLRGNSNIVSYEDHQVFKKPDELKWTIYIRMELLTPLFEYYASHQCTVSDVIKLGIDVCKALEYCVKLNIIHRDIKPSNILVSDLGDYKLGDFGIARRLGSMTQTMTMGIGTENYMAPEVFNGKSYDFTVDMYSLGLVMYQLLNNNRLPFLPAYPAPFTYNDQVTAKLNRMSGKQLPPICGNCHDLYSIIIKACAYNPKERYETPTAMREALEKLSVSLFASENRINLKPEEYSGKSSDSEKEEIIDKTVALIKDDSTVCQSDINPSNPTQDNSDDNRLKSDNQVFSEQKVELEESKEIIQTEKKSNNTDLKNNNNGSVK